MCCVREPGHHNCSLCQRQSRECRFDSIPKTRPGRVPSRHHQAVADNGGTASVGESAALAAQRQSQSSCAGANEQRDITSSSRGDKGQRSLNWKTTQFVGLSGDQDPFVLQHVSFNESNCYTQPDWMCMRVNGGGFIPMQFTVRCYIYLLYNCRSLSVKLTNGFEFT
jgi:hypothetical protein